MASNTDLVIADLRGGMNDDDPPHSLPDNQCVLAENVEFFFSTLGERRRGMEAVNLAGAGIASEDAIVHLGAYAPALGSPADAVTIGVGATIGTSTTFSQRVAGSWFDISAITDAPTTTRPDVLDMRSQGLHSKWFVAYKSGVDRTHVYDGTSIRRVGLAAPTAAPTALDTAVAGTFTGDRLYRVRVQTQVSGTPTQLSEPSPEVSFTPAGTFNGAVITRPTLPGEGETHWVLEASDGDGDWYALSTIAVATTTYTDTVQPATEYATVGTLSADIGEYDYPPSVRIIKADEDRAIYIGSWEDPEKGSRVYWSPTYAAPGVGNDERVPSNIDSFKDLDWQDGGAITDASDPVSGAFYVFKWQRIYKAQRTGNAYDAYTFYLLDPSHGALPGSVVRGVDEYGRGAVYFIDPAVGPMRIASAGVQQLRNLQAVWRRVNTTASEIACRGLFYPDKKQVHWWVAVDAATSPNLKLVVQTNFTRTNNEGGTDGGWTIATGDIATAWCVLTVPENVTRTDGSVQLSYRPYMGFNGSHKLQVGDIGSTDNGVSYRAHIVTKPYIVAGLLNKWGAMAAALLAEPNTTSSLVVRLTRDFGKETNELTTDFVPDGSESQVIKVFDHLIMSDARAIQVEFQDPAI